MACGAASAQVALTQVEGSHLQCPDSYIAACVEKLERNLVAAQPDAIRRNADESFSVKLSNGRWLTPPNECLSCDFALELLQDSRYLAMLSFGEEDLFWKLLDRQTGKIVSMEGYPLFSPDGRHIASAESDEMNIDALDVYEVRASGPVRMFQAIPPTPGWFPKRVCWADNTTISYERWMRGMPEDKLRATESIALRHGKWRIAAGGPRCAGMS
jgi:hypothetical protein